MSFHQIIKIRLGHCDLILAQYCQFKDIMKMCNFNATIMNATIMCNYNENVQLYPIPLLSSCMYAIKTISELKELVLLVNLTFTLKVKPIGAVI